jgi:hypothetical protein
MWTILPISVALAVQWPYIPETVLERQIATLLVRHHGPGARVRIRAVGPINYRGSVIVRYTVFRPDGGHARFCSMVMVGGGWPPLVWFENERRPNYPDIFTTHGPPLQHHAPPH